MARHIKALIQVVRRRETGKHLQSLVEISTAHLLSHRLSSIRLTSQHHQVQVRLALAIHLDLSRA
jgi:hypothetical protein